MNDVHFRMDDDVLRKLAKFMVEEMANRRRYRREVVDMLTVDADPKQVHPRRTVHVHRDDVVGFEGVDDDDDRGVGIHSSRTLLHLRGGSTLEVQERAMRVRDWLERGDWEIEYGRQR